MGAFRTVIAIPMLLAIEKDSMAKISSKELREELSRAWALASIVTQAREEAVYITATIALKVYDT